MDADGNWSYTQYDCEEMAVAFAEETFWGNDYTLFPLYNSIYEPECTELETLYYECQSFNYFW